VRLPRHFALCLLLLLPCGARADDIGPDQAQSLQQQLKGWLAGLLGPSIKLPDLPWQITGEHDHYLITWPIRGLETPKGDVGVTATLRPLDDGRWSIEDLKAPPAGSFTMTLPEGPDSKGGPAKVGFTVGKQDNHGVIDPGLTTASNFHSEIGEVAVTTDSANGHQEQHFDRYLVDTALKPESDGRLDLTVDGTATGWRSAAQVNKGTPVAIGIDTMHAVGRIQGVNRERVAAVLAAAGNLVGALPADTLQKGGKAELTAPARAQLRLIATALQDVFTAISLEENLDGLKVEVAGMGGVSMKHFGLGFGGEAPDGKLHIWFDIGLDGLDSPSLPPKIAAYLPHHIELRPSLSGIQTADLRKLALDATDKDADVKELTPDVMAMFAHGGIDVAVERLAFDLGPAKVEGVAHVNVLSPGAWRGTAHLTATGLDDLTTQARGNPDLQQALPVLIMLRGLAKPEGDHLVWNIESDGPNMIVNGIDLSQLGGDKQRKPPGQPPKR
jgi:hypothetical protein